MLSLEDLSEQIAAVLHDAVEVVTDVALRQAVEAGYPADSSLPPIPRARNVIAPCVKLVSGPSREPRQHPSSSIASERRAKLATSEPLRDSAIRP
jgi:hypothetical protein